MKQDEIYEFINQIKKDYPKFNVGTDEEYQVWKDILSKTSYELIKAKYQEHKNNEDYKKYPPKATYFTYESKSDEPIKYLRHCKYCGRLMYNEALDLHEDRHRSINYIVKRKNQLWNKPTTDEEETEFINMTQDKFDSKYLEFLKLVYQKITNPTEKRNIENIVYLTEHPTETIAPQEYKLKTF